MQNKKLPNFIRVKQLLIKQNRKIIYKIQNFRIKLEKIS